MKKLSNCVDLITLTYIGYSSKVVQHITKHRLKGRYNRVIDHLSPVARASGKCHHHNVSVMKNIQTFVRQCSTYRSNFTSICPFLSRNPLISSTKIYSHSKNIDINAGCVPVHYLCILGKVLCGGFYSTIKNSSMLVMDDTWYHLRRQQ